MKIPRTTKISSLNSEHLAMLAIMRVFHILLPPTPSDAVVVFSGWGDHRRVKHGIELWQSGLAENILIAGMTIEENERFGTYSLDVVIDMAKDMANQTGYRDAKMADKIFTQGSALHAADQADWAIATAKEHGFRSVIVVASWCHLPRAFLTLLKSMLKQGITLELSCSAVPKVLTFPPRFESKSGYDFSEYNVFIGELKRIVAYQEQGDVATLDELRRHLGEE